MCRRRSTPLPFAAALAAGLFGLAAGRAADPPVVVLSTNPDLPATGQPSGSGAINLIPNGKLSYYVYVHNPNTDEIDTPFTVVLSSDENARDALALAKVDKIAGKATLRVALNATATPPVAPPAPPAKNPDGTPAAVAADPGLKLPRRVYLTVWESATKPFVGSKPTILDINLEPNKFLSASAAYTKSANNELTITVTLSQPKVGQPLTADAPALNVKLDVRPELIPNLDPNSTKEGTYETVFAPDSKEVKLVAKNLKSTTQGDLAGKIAIGVNGFERAFMFNIKTSGTDASPDAASFVRIDVPRYAIPGKPLAARLEIYEVANNSVPQLTFDRNAGGEPETVTRRVYDKNGINTRDVKLFAKFEKSGEIVCSSAVQDWIIPLDTKGVYGDGKLELKVNEQNKANAVVTFDDTPPVVTADGFRAITPAPKPKGKAKDDKTPLDPVVHIFPVEAGKHVPARIEKGKTLRLAAQASDDKAPVDAAKVLFFLGDPPTAEGKPAAGGKVEPGTAWRPDWKIAPKGPLQFPGNWFGAEFDTEELKGKVKVGVRFVNKAGLITEVIREVVVFEPPPPRTLGDVKVSVTQGYSPERPQPGLDVSLLADGKIVAAGKTNDKGEASFKDLKPGAYTVFSVKPGDGNARAFSVVTVIADDEVSTSLSLKR